MIKPLQIRSTTLGEGCPKIIVPIVDKTTEAILDKAKEIVAEKVDMVEWRVDFFEDVEDIARVLDTLAQLRKALGGLVLLFTFRTKEEGGVHAASKEFYEKLNLAVAASKNVDMIDVELFSGDELVKRVVDCAHENGVYVVMSNHDFFKTPAKEEIVKRLRMMQERGADVPKMAVMPQSTADVLTMLDATNEMNALYADRPILTMSMSATGVISRLAGEVFGSCATFGALGQASAPGQIPVSKLRTVLDILHQSL